MLLYSDQSEMSTSIPRHMQCFLNSHRRAGLFVRPNVIGKLPNRRLQSSSSQTTQQSSTPERIVFSGIQPTGIPHLGNYLGALREWVRLQDSATDGTKLIFSIVDLHALTVPPEPSHLRQRRKQTFAMLLAVGLDPARSTIFYQSDVCAHFCLLRRHQFL